MSEFEKCPITGKVPEWSGSDYRLSFKLPFMSSHYVSRYCGARDTAIKWWHNEYIPAARKLAEQQEPEWEPQVGDVVGPSLYYFESRSPVSLLGNRTAKIVKIVDITSMVILNRPLFDDITSLGSACLRFISRPNQLTVADLPEIDGYEWRDETDGLWLYGDEAKYMRHFGVDESRIKAALDFCRKIADGMKKMEVGDE